MRREVHISNGDIQQIAEAWRVGIDECECQSCLLAVADMMRQLAGRAELRVQAVLAAVARDARTNGPVGVS